MSKDLQQIRKKIQNIQFGILRCRQKNDQKSWQVKATSDTDNVLHCLVESDEPYTDIVNKSVNLVQKHHDDYLYITGTVDAEVHDNVKILSIRIMKACWFVRRQRGSITWLQEKYMYQNEELELAS
jgi:hypothetical protein